MKDTLLKIFFDYCTQLNWVHRHVLQASRFSTLYSDGIIDTDTIDQSMPNSAYPCTHYSVFLCHG